MKIVNPQNTVNYKHPLNKGRVGWWMRIPNSGWSGGLTFRDLVRNKKPNDGTLVNGPKWSGARGRLGGYSSLNFTSASSQYVTVTTSIAAAPYTIAVWARSTDSASPHTAIALSRATQTDSHVRLLNNSGTWRLNVIDASGTQTNLDGPAVVSNTWIHLLVTKDLAPSGYILYVNGSPVGSPLSDVSMNAYTVLTLGALQFSSVLQFFDGQLDDATLYNRSLSAAEVRALYKQSRHGHPDTLNWISPKSYYIPASTPLPATISSPSVIKTRTVNPTSLVNWKHPLNKGRVGWWMRIPNSGWSGGLIFRDLVRNKKPNDGTLVNGPTWTGSRGRPGGYGAVNLDGSNDYVNFGDNTAFEFASGQAFSIACWFKGISSVNQTGFLTKGYDSLFGANDTPWYLFRWNQNATPGSMDWFLRSGSGDTILAATGMTDDKWHHLVATYDGASGAQLYIDGNSKATSTSVTAAAYGTNSSPLILGTHIGNYFNGLFDDLSVWKGRTFSAVEVRALYDQSRRGHPDTLNWISSRSYSLISTSSSDTLSATSGNFSLSGKTSLFNDKIVANYRSLNFSSTTTAFLNKLLSSIDSIILSGRSSNFSVKSVNSSSLFSLSGKTNTANLVFPSLTTSYALSGRSALFNSSLKSNVSNYLLTSPTTGLNYSNKSSYTAFSLSGNPLTFNVKSVANSTNYVLAGKTSTPNRLFTSSAGSYSLLGQNTFNLFKLGAQQGSIVFTGNDVQFIVFSGSTLVASRGTFSLFGNALFNLKVTANSTNYVLSGKSSAANRLFTSAKGNYSLSGKTSNFNYLNRSFSGSYSLTSPAIILKLLFSSARGSYSLNGRNTVFNYSIISPRGSFSLTGKNALNILRFAAQRGSIVFTGNDAELISLIFGYILSANRGLFTLSGKSAQLIAQYNQLASPDYTKLKGFIDIGKSLIMDQLSDNLIMFFNWSLLNVGAFTNISRSDTLNPFGDRSKLRLVEEPNYVAGRVWEGFQGNWVWESGLYYPILPFVPAIYVNNTLVTTGFKINYPLGRVIFDAPLLTNSVVEAKFSVRRYNFYPSNVPWFKQILFASYLANDPHFLETAQGKWADILGQNRITLPAVVVEVSPRRNMRGLQLGGGHWVDIDVLFHIFAEDSWDRDKLIDIISMQREKTIILFDKNALLAADDYPLNDYGDVKTTAKMYPTLLEDYSWKRCFFKEVMPQDVLSIPPLFRGVARLTCEIDFPEF
jgi:hypothetical protein